MGAPEPDDTGPPPAQRPRSVATPSRSRPQVGHHAGKLPRTPAGTFVHARSFPAPPANRPAPGAGPAALIGQPVSVAPPPVRQLSGGPGQPSTLVRATHGQRSTILPARPGSGSDDQATRRPRRYIEHGCPHTTCPTTATSGIQRDADSTAAAAADTGRLAVRTPGITPDAWTPVVWTPDVRPTGRADVRMADSGRGQGDERRGRRSDTLGGHDDRDGRLGGPTSLGLQRLRCSAADDRLCVRHTCRRGAWAVAQHCST
jgi:hypothetical protein